MKTFRARVSIVDAVPVKGITAVVTEDGLVEELDQVFPAEGLTLMRSSHGTGLVPTADFERAYVAMEQPKPASEGED